MCITWSTVENYSLQTLTLICAYHECIFQSTYKRQAICAHVDLQKKTVLQKHTIEIDIDRYRYIDRELCRYILYKIWIIFFYFIFTDVKILTFGKLPCAFFQIVTCIDWFTHGRSAFWPFWVYFLVHVHVPTQIYEFMSCGSF